MAQGIHLKTTEKVDLIQCPPVVKETAVEIALPRNVLAIANTSTGFSLDPFLAVAVFGVLYILAGMEKRFPNEPPIDVSRMRHIGSGDDPH